MGAISRLERMGSLLVALRAALQAQEADIWTALPAIVQSYDATKMTVSAQPTVQAQQRSYDGAVGNINLPVCPDCPVVWPGGGGFVMTFPLSAGDEGVLVFASRCIDGWWDQGGVQPQLQLRMHDLSDGFFLPVCFSKPRVPTGVSATGVRIQNMDGTKYVEFTSAGDLRCTGEIVKGFGTVDQVTVGQHRHPGNNTPPTPGT